MTLKTLIGGPKLEHLLVLLQRAVRHPGAVAEFGVYHGGTLKIMAELCPDRTCYGFDTFEGLPAEKWNKSEPHSVGDFSDCDYLSLKAAMPPNVQLVRGVFPQSARGIDSPICFAHVDFDFYESTLDAIHWLKAHMVAGAIAVFDDYDWPHCPGVRKAIEDTQIHVQKSMQHQVFWVNE